MTNWTFETLREHILAIINERDERYDQRFLAQEKAIAKAEAAVERRLENTNEWRAVINDLVKAHVGQQSGIKASWSVAVALISLAIAALALLK